MLRFLVEACIAIPLLFSDACAGSPEPLAAAVLDKAIAAIGSPGKFAKSKGFTWKANSRHGGFRDCESQATVRGIDCLRLEVWDEQVRIIRIVEGERGWVIYGGVTRKMRGEELAAWTQGVYLEAIAATPFTMRSQGLKYQASPDESVGDKPAAVLRVTGPDGKDLKLYFDKESGLPSKVAALMPEFPEKMCMREIVFAEYRDFDGVKKATRLTFKTNGIVEHVLEVTAFKLLESVDSKTFFEPK